MLQVAVHVAEKLLQLGAVPLTFSDGSGHIYEPGVGHLTCSTLHSVTARMQQSSSVRPVSCRYLLQLYIDTQWQGTQWQDVPVQEYLSQLRCASRFMQLLLRDCDWGMLGHADMCPSFPPLLPSGH